MLNYQKTFIQTLLMNYNLQDKKILELGGHDGTIKRALENEGITGVCSIDIDPQSDCVLEMNAEKLTFDDNDFDFVISLATFEHIANPQKAIQEAYRVLKPNGSIYLRFSPIWTAINGHHYNISNYEESVIPSWGHLYFDENEMMAYLSNKKYRKAAEACKFIYHSNYINRLSLNSYMTIFRGVPYKHKIQLLKHLRIEEEFSKIPEQYRMKLDRNVLVNGIIFQGEKQNE